MRVIGALQIFNLWLGLYSAPGEWPWTYFFLFLLQLMFAVHCYGRSLGIDALLDGGAGHPRAGCALPNPRRRGLAPVSAGSACLAIVAAVADFEHLDLLDPGGGAELDGVALMRLHQRAGDRGDPAHLAAGEIGFVDADDRDRLFAPAADRRR